jgi:translation initiation factor 3 subunit F
MAMGRTVLHMPSGHTGVVAKLHPTVLFNICDSYIRRNDQQERVIGTLLGSISADGTVEIRNSYAVPHSEQADQVRSSFQTAWKRER